MNDPLIRTSQPSRKNFQLINGIRTWKFLMPFLKPLFQLFGIDMDKAENDLVEYYGPENIDWKLLMMQGVKVFQPRMALADWGQGAL